MPVYCVETNMKYNSYIEAERATGIPNGNIRQTAIGKRRSAGGFHWEKVNGTE